MISATPKNGFLIEDGTKLGAVVGLLRAFSATSGQQFPRDLAEWLNGIPHRTYYEPIPRPLVEQISVIEEVAR